MKKLLTLALCICMLCHAKSQTLPAGFSTTAIGSGWTQPVGAVFSKDGQKLFVWEKEGRVYVCNRNGSGNYIKQATPVINLREEVGGWRDHGLLGFALDPEFASNGRIYLLYVVDRHHLMNFGTGSYNPATDQYFAATIGRITRYQTAMSGSDLVANPASRTVLLGETPSTGVPILYESHSVGGLAFTADGMLLASTGDGASYSTSDGGNVAHTYYTQALLDGIIRPEENVGSFRSQLLNSHNGKLLRLDPETGNGVGSNPFFDPAEPRAPKSRVWAMGFRNPFRIAVKPGSGSTNPTTGDIGEIYVGDVGWNLWEELNVITAPGMNCGWPLFEGHTTLNSYYSMTTVNRDAPNPLYNGTTCTQQYFTFKSLLKQATADQIKTVFNPCDNTQSIGDHNRNFHRRPSIDYRHGSADSRVPTFTGNNATVATIGTPASNVTGTPFSGNCVVAGTWYTGTAYPATYQNSFFMADLGGQWLKRVSLDFTDVVTRVDNFGSGFSNLVCVTQNPLDGTLVTVEIGGTGVKRINFGGNIPPVPVPVSDIAYGPAALQVNFSGASSFDQDGTVTGYSWDFGDGNTSTEAAPTHTFNAPAGVPTKFVVKLTVTDNAGASATDSIIISANNTPPLVQITSPIDDSYYQIGTDTMYACTANVSDAEFANGQLTYAWQTFLRHNNHEHAEQIDPLPATSTRISRIGCNGDTYHWFFRLTVTDPAGLVTSDSASIYPECGTTLPLLLHRFSVTQESGVNMVRWETELESNMEYFEVERSEDGVNFYRLNQQAASNNAAGREYSYADASFPAGTLFYRLKMIERGSIIRYSVVIKVSSGRIRGLIKVSPNPVHGNFSLTYFATKRGNVHIRIYDAQGKQIAVLNEFAEKGNNIIYVQDRPEWGNGLYYIQLRQDDDLQQAKFLKVR